MARFDKELPEWNATGTKPPQSTIEAGWKAKQKPPADYFNWFFNTTYFALKEVQEKVLLASDTTTWQKFPVTTIDGLPYSSNSIDDWDDLLSIKAMEVAISGLVLTKNKPPEGVYFDVSIHRRTATTGHVIAVDMANNTLWLRSRSGRVGGETWSDWLKIETTAGSDQKIADLRSRTQNAKITQDNGVSKRLSGADLNTIFELGFYYCIGSTNKPTDWGNLYLFVIKGSEDSPTSSYYKQIAFEYKTGKMATRDRLQGNIGDTNWTDWVVIETETGSAQKVTDLKNLLVKLLPTLENGSQKVAVREGQDVYEEFLNLPAGFYTLYAASTAKNNVPTGKSIRGTIMKTAPNYGYIIAVDYANNLFTNYYDANSGWTGWKTYGTGENVLLFSGSAYGIGTQFNLADDFTKYKYLIVELDGAAGILTLLASTNPRASIVLEFSNIGDDLGNASLYEIQFSVVNNKRFKILHDFGYTLNGNTGSDTNRTKILNIWGAL